MNLKWTSGSSGTSLSSGFFEQVHYFENFIEDLLCKLAIYCVYFGVNFILQKFCLCKKNDKYQVCYLLESNFKLTWAFCKKKPFDAKHCRQIQMIHLYKSHEIKLSSPHQIQPFQIS